MPVKYPLPAELRPKFRVYCGYPEVPLGGDTVGYDSDRIIERCMDRMFTFDITLIEQYVEMFEVLQSTECLPDSEELKRVLLIWQGMYDPAIVLTKEELLLLWRMNICSAFRIPQGPLFPPVCNEQLKQYREYFSPTIMQVADRVRISLLEIPNPPETSVNIPLLDEEKDLVRRFCGYPATGEICNLSSGHYEQSKAKLEYEMDHFDIDKYRSLCMQLITLRAMTAMAAWPPIVETPGDYLVAAGRNKRLYDHKLLLCRLIGVPMGPMLTLPECDHIGHTVSYL